MSSERVSTVDQIFYAVMELILDGGLAAVTLSAVCARAGLSRGGLTHHYPSKESLVDAFIARSCNECLEKTRLKLSPLPNGTGRRCKAYVDLMLKEPAMCDSNESREVAAVMIALMQGNFAQHASRYYEAISELLCNDGLTIALIDLVVSAVDGLWIQAAILPDQAVTMKAEKLRVLLHGFIDAELA